MLLERRVLVADERIPLRKLLHFVLRPHFESAVMCVEDEACNYKDRACDARDHEHVNWWSDDDFGHLAIAYQNTIEREAEKQRRVQSLQVCDAVEQSHYKNITLRNIKINNIMTAPGVIMGDPTTQSIKGLTFDNVVVSPTCSDVHAYDRLTASPRRFGRLLSTRVTAEGEELKKKLEETEKELNEIKLTGGAKSGGGDDGGSTRRAVDAEKAKVENEKKKKKEEEKRKDEEANKEMAAMMAMLGR